MSFPRYPAYKDSGVEWLGAIPHDWSVHRLKHVCSVSPSNVDKKSYDDELPVRLCNYTDVYYNEVIGPAIEFMHATASVEQISRFELKAGDIVITKDSETADDIAISAYVPNDLADVICGYHLALIRPGTAVNGSYVKRLFDSRYLKSRFAVAANGLTRVGLSQYALDNVEIPVPSVVEQTAIAAFLDRETAMIDALVAEQAKLIALLKEKRQAVISHAVTKGLDPNAPMKPSGIEWLGDVPAHWEVRAIKTLALADKSLFIDGDWIESVNISDSGIRYITTGNVGEGRYKEQGSGFISEQTFHDLNCTEVLPGDVLISRLNPPIGRACVVPDLGTRIVTSVDNVILRADEGFDPAFLVYRFSANDYLSEAANLASGATMQRISRSELGNLRVSFPPMREQCSIAAYLDEAVSRYDAGIAEALSANVLLKERRAALISAAVTGQIDVRGLVV